MQNIELIHCGSAASAYDSSRSSSVDYYSACCTSASSAITDCMEPSNNGATEEVVGGALNVGLALRQPD
jgi:hypothetical protein